MLSFAKEKHADSYYAHTRNQSLSYPELKDDIEADVCIIGGGLTGISAALNLAEQGKSVVVLEGALIGFGASGRNGGQVISGFACDIDVICDQLGEEAAKVFWDMSLEAVDIINHRVDQHKIDCDWTRGYVTVAVKERQMDELLQWQESLKKRFGYDAYTAWDKKQLQSHLNSERYQGGLYETFSGHLHPLNYCLGLAKAAQDAGTLIFENTPVEDVDLQENGSYIVRAGLSKIRAKTVILAANAFISKLPSHLSKELSRKIMPVGTYMIATEPLGEERAKSLIDNNMAVCDSNFVLDYYRLSKDHRLLFGGKVSYSGKTPHNLSEAMRRDMLRVFPQLSDAKVDYAWGGFCDVTMNRAPHFGRLQPNLYFAQGFSGHGVAATGLAGKVISDAICGDDSRLRLFEQIKHHDFPGGPLLRTSALILAMSYFRLHDYL